MCCASGLLTTVGAADFTYDGFWGTVGLLAAYSPSCKVGGGPGGSGGLIIGGGPYGGLGTSGTIIPGWVAPPGIPGAGNGGRMSNGGGGGGGGKLDNPGGNTSAGTLGIKPGPGTVGCCLGGGGGGAILERSVVVDRLLPSASEAVPPDSVFGDF